MRAKKKKTREKKKLNKDIRNDDDDDDDDADDDGGSGNSIDDDDDQKMKLCGPHINNIDYIASVRVQYIHKRTYRELQNGLNNVLMPMSFALFLRINLSTAFK